MILHSGFTDSIAKSGHHLFISLLHLEALQKLNAAAVTCPGASAALSAMHERAAEIKAALAGPLLWNQSAGMFRPSSGNCAHLVDIWGSALAVHNYRCYHTPSDRGYRQLVWKELARCVPRRPSPTPAKGLSLASDWPGGGSVAWLLGV